MDREYGMVKENLETFIIIIIVKNTLFTKLFIIELKVRVLENSILDNNKDEKFTSEF